MVQKPSENEGDGYNSWNNTLKMQQTRGNGAKRRRVKILEK